jgi:hypothetical protein
MGRPPNLIPKSLKGRNGFVSELPEYDLGLALHFFNVRSKLYKGRARPCALLNYNSRKRNFHRGPYALECASYALGGFINVSLNLIQRTL